jgi:curli biogenesis system outer membrane secretion channel CsgG
VKVVLRLCAAGVTAVMLLAVSVAPADAAASYQNCTALQKTYPHGVGKLHAHDSTSGTPVTNFKHSTKKYKKAVRANGNLDRDGDGIACEKR